VAVHALLRAGRALRDVANRLFRILPGKRLLSGPLSFDACVLLPLPTSDVSLPRFQADFAHRLIVRRGEHSPRDISRTLAHASTTASGSALLRVLLDD
jgi:hypothetical protein